MDYDQEKTLNSMIGYNLKVCGQTHQNDKKLEYIVNRKHREAEFSTNLGMTNDTNFTVNGPISTISGDPSFGIQSYLPQ